MDEKSFRILEFDKIKQQLEQYASSTLGKELIRSITPYQDKNKVEYHLKITEEARSLYKEGFSLQGLKDARRALRRARIGSVLDIDDLLNVADTLRCARNSKIFVERRKERYPLLAQLTAALTALPAVEATITECIDPEGLIRDNASPALRRIRNEMRRHQTRIKQHLDALVRSPQMQKYLQEALVTVRNERYVVPVKAEYRGLVKGLVHDQSASGATVFIEPMPVVEMNNRLKQLEVEEQREEQRILQRLSKLVADQLPAVEQNVNTMAVFDLLLAKGRYSAAINGCAPQVNDEGYLRLTQARHPLIESDQVVPIDIELGGDFDVLVITGPNTGGKTVTLKTVGLLQLMAQAGIHIPAAPTSHVAVFDKIYADIGDEQSIEQSLSTFSSHMTNIVRILAEADHRSLLLFDELGAGTDPTEGAALAMAILDEVHARGSRVIATTHYSELKNYAYRIDGVSNASVEFDVDTLRPTYKLSIGVPGRSNAFLISRRLGLSEHIIARAESYLDSDVKQVSDIIVDLEDSRRQAEQARDEAVQEREELRRLRAEYEAQLEEIQQIKRDARKKALREARIYVERLRKAMQGVIAELKEQARQANRSQLDDVFRVAREKVRNQEEAIAAELEELEPVDTHYEQAAAGPLAVGDKVRHLELNTEAVVVTEPNEAGEVQVQMGSLKTWTHVSKLSKLKTPASDARQQRIGIVKTTTSRKVPLELDLRGKTVAEALAEIDKYLDSALLAGREQVGIIHGKGTGALRNGVREYLDNHPLVSSHRLGHAGEGGSGITIVTLKK